MKNTIRCPYCVFNQQIHSIVAHVDGRHICDRCGHTTNPSDPRYTCRCLSCSDVKASQHLAS